MTHIYNKTKTTTIATRAKIADSYFQRMKGLLGRASLQEEEVLVITRCNSIHMFFMKFAIDVIFVDKQRRVVGLVPEIQPFQLSAIFWKASYAVECPRGTIARKNVAIGDEIEIK